MKKRIALFMAAILLLLPAGALAGTVENARDLYDLGLLRGTGSAFSEEGLELDRYATRAEVCITILRMLGKEEKAAYQQNAHPFTDVPAWAGDGIGWLYENYLVNGVSDTYFGAQDTATVQQFSAMLLRVLGYSDKKGDFSYDGATGFAVNNGLADPAVAQKQALSRRDMIDMCHRALRLPIKNSSRLLISKLCDEGAVDTALAQSKGILTAPSVSDSFGDVPMTLGKITVSRDGTALRIHMETPVEHYGVRVFMQEESGSAQEIPAQGTPYMVKGQVEYIGGGSAGYIRDIYIYGLDTGKKYEFIVLKTSSEGELYLISGKSATAWN